MLVIPLHRSTLILAVLDPFEGVGPALARLEKELGAGDLAIIFRSGMVPVMMHGFSADQGREIIRKGDASNLRGRSAHHQARVSSAVSPHVGAGSIQDRYARFSDA